MLIGYSSIMEKGIPKSMLHEVMINSFYTVHIYYFLPYIKEKEKKNFTV